MLSPYMQGKNTHAPQADLNLKTDRWSKIGLIAVLTVFDCGPLQEEREADSNTVVVPRGAGGLS